MAERLLSQCGVKLRDTSSRHAQGSCDRKLGLPPSVAPPPASKTANDLRPLRHDPRDALDPLRLPLGREMLSIGGWPVAARRMICGQRHAGERFTFLALWYQALFHQRSDAPMIALV